MAMLIAGLIASGKLKALLYSRLISAGNSCTSQGMGDKTAILAANAVYYRAFATADFAAMSRIWTEDNASCVHPGWPALVGRQAILESYREILCNRTRSGLNIATR
jgi:ketosteroid isomerase-like protein